jgi:outer membrane protein OmpA-like peptidoglycan-associated protein
MDGEDVTLRKDVLVKRPKAIKTEEYLPEIQHVYFDFDKSELRQESKNELDMIAAMLRKNKDLSIKILGHTDYYGTFDYNVALSERRSSSVKAYLTNAGISPARLDDTWFSENKPIETNEDDTGRQYNRRVEFRIERNGQALFSSVKLRKGSEGPWVDHTKPKGLPGYDNPDGEILSDAATTPETDNSNPGFFDEIETTSLPTVSSNSLLNDDVAEVNLHHIYFGFDQFALRPESKKELDRIVDLLTTNGGFELEIRGHTDAFGDLSYNQMLSENRANSAYAYLVGRGVSQSQLRVSGFSEEKPIATNDDGLGRQQNRRVEFVLRKGPQTVLVSNP